jgi:O-acetyl-ADP-ribose deacetylase (regulator of RNase III)
MNIKLIKGDITKMEVDAVVNAAKNSLMGGGGVDGAIHAAGGPAILEECKKIREERGDLPTGDAVATTAGNMPAKYIIHTVGPVWHGGTKNEPELLAKAYRSTLQLATEKELKTVALPNISTGVYGYPKYKAARIAVETVKAYLAEHPDMEVTFVCFDDENYGLYQSLL